VTKQYTNYFGLRGETPTNKESREKDQGLKPNWTPSDKAEVRQDTGKGGGRFPQFREIPKWRDSAKNAFAARRKSK
jgi:hypothetical protein